VSLRSSAGPTVPAVLALGLGVLTACTLTVGPSPLETGARTVDPGALEAAGCVEVEPGDTRNRDHLDPAEAPPASELYDTDLPAAGPHFGRWSPVIEDLPATPLDVRALLHNLEHGAVVVWLNPAVLDEGTLGFAEQWRRQLGDAGFDHDDTGTAVFVSRFPGELESRSLGELGRPVGVALRAWGVAVDCDAWDLAAADAFVGLHYGTRGQAPEAELGPYPHGNGVLVGPPDLDDRVTTTA